VSSPGEQPTLLQRLLGSWATRTLAFGALATLLDLALGSTLRHFGLATHLAAMCGTTLGAVFGFFTNRAYAFRDHEQSLARSAAKYAVMSLTLSTVHGQVTEWLCDGQGAPYVLAKIGADLLVFTVNQPPLLRYFVFPKKAQPA
jgi:putative flippase GtrA